MNPFCYTPGALVGFTLFGQVQCYDIFMTTVGVPQVSALLYLKVFILTCLLEFPFYFVCLGRRAFIATLILNLATHPMVSFGIPYLMRGEDYYLCLWVGEVFAPALEGFLLGYVWKVKWTRAVSIAILANLVSWWVGVYLI